jgi:hypothetical protein
LQEKIKLLANPRIRKRNFTDPGVHVKPTIQADKVLLLILKPHKVRGKLIQPGNLKTIGAITGKQENPTVYAGPRAKGNFYGFTDILFMMV